MKCKGFILLTWLLIAVTGAHAQTAEAPFAGEIRKFKELDSISPPQQHAILFIGSSSFTLWKDVNAYFPGFAILNRAFGGSRLTDQIRYVNEVVFPYHPKEIVLYCGENDFAHNDTLSPAAVTARFVTLFSLIRERFPEIPFVYVSMKPSPSRWHLAPRFREANAAIREFMASQTNTWFVDIWDKMLDQHNQPADTLFLEDKLHMNASGYHIWQHEITPVLIR